MACYAPVFEPSGFCIFRAIFLALAIVVLIVATLGFIFFSESGRCLIAQLRFRITNCSEGNQNPQLEIAS